MAQHIDQQIDELIAGPAGETASDEAERLLAIFDPPPSRASDAIGPQYGLLKLTSAFMARLRKDHDYELWTEQETDDTDGLLRELGHQAVALRPLLVAGEPDLPPGSDLLARADLLDGISSTPETRKALRLLAATVQAFQDAGLHDGDHFTSMCSYVWGIDPDPSTDVLTARQACETLQSMLGIAEPEAMLILAEAAEHSPWTRQNPARGVKSMTVTSVKGGFRIVSEI